MVLNFITVGAKLVVPNAAPSIQCLEPMPVYIISAGVVFVFGGASLEWLSKRPADNFALLKRKLGTWRYAAKESPDQKRFGLVCFDTFVCWLVCCVCLSPGYFLRDQAVLLRSAAQKNRKN